MCSGQATFESTIDKQHDTIFQKFDELIEACKSNFQTEESKTDSMCPHHKKEHEQFLGNLKGLKQELHTHIKVHDKPLINGLKSVCKHKLKT